jgi:hypothetical protein
MLSCFLGLLLSWYRVFLGLLLSWSRPFLSLLLFRLLFFLVSCFPWSLVFLGLLLFWSRVFLDLLFSSVNHFKKFRRRGLHEITHNPKLPRRRPARRHTKGYSTAILIKIRYFSLLLYFSTPFYFTTPQPITSRNSLHQCMFTRQTCANRKPVIGVTWTGCRSSPK